MKPSKQRGGPSHRDFLARLGLCVVVGLTASSAAADTAPDADKVEARDRPAPGIAEAIVVVGTRTSKHLDAVPAAVSVIEKAAIQRAQRQLTLGESLSAIPGVFVQNLGNFAQDSRISIRGFGGRAAFGIRGIKLYQDGIPLTTPDGQGQVDTIALGSANRIEILRGPSASLYGSASGGVIRIESEDGPPLPLRAETRLAFGSHGYRDYQGKAGGQVGSLNYRFDISWQEIDGYRDHSQMRNSKQNLKIRWELDDQSELVLLATHLRAPDADDPGGLTRDEVRDKRSQARARNVAFRAGESIESAIIGLQYERQHNERHRTRVTSHYTWRDFKNKLPIVDGGRVVLDRSFTGGSLQHFYEDSFFGRSNRLTTGFDIEAQFDDRIRKDNLMGTTGNKVFDQDEDVTSIGVFLQDELRLIENVELTGSARYDRVHYDIDDNFKSDGDDSGTPDFDEFSYSGAVLWSPTPLIHPYVRISTSFEVPTTTELANPDGGGGFNKDLKSTTAINYEFGVKGRFQNRARYEVAIFYIETDDELIPFEVDERTFFENAGETERFGLEAAFDMTLHPGVTTSFAYTYSEFEFDSFQSGTEDFKRNWLPGIPRHLFHAGIKYESDCGLFATWETQYVSKRFADNDNTSSAGHYSVSNVRAGYRVSLKSWELSAFAGLNNVFKETYIDNLRINARGDRYFEPAPRFNAYGGLSISYSFGSAEPGH